MTKELHKSGTEEPTAEELGRFIPRRHDAVASPLTTVPRRAGASFFFEVKSGWEVRALADDDRVRKVYTKTGLGDAFDDQTVRTILVPRDAAITKNAVLRVCTRHGQGKTVFYEVAAG